MIFFMIIYTICAMLGFGLLFFGNKTVSIKNGRSFKIENAVVLVCYIFLFLLCGLRSVTIGYDTKAYCDSFLYKDVLNRTVAGGGKFEPGYKLLVKFIRLLTDNDNLFIFIVSTIIFAGIYVFIKYNCTNNYMISTLIFLALLYYVTFSAVRQSLALAIAVNSFYFLKNKNWIKATLLILLGGLFHYTAFILLIMVPLAIIKDFKKRIIISLSLSLIGIVLFNQIVNVVLYLFPIYRRYWESEMIESSKASIGVYAILVIVLCVYSIFMIFKSKVKFDSDEEENAFILALAGSILAICINIIGRKYGILSRISRYFIPFVMVQSVGVYKYMINRKKIFYVGIALLMGGYFYLIMKKDLYGIIPYKFFFN